MGGDQGRGTAAKDDKSALAGVALALPALERATKLQKRAARTGFDWPDIEGPKAKIREELDEIAEAPPESSRKRSATCCSPSSTSHGI